MKIRIKEILLFVILFCMSTINVVSQNSNVGIGTTSPVPSSILHIESIDKGLLIPRVALQSLGDQATVPNVVAGLLVFNTTFNSVLDTGFYYWSGSAWISVNGYIGSTGSTGLTGIVGPSGIRGTTGTTGELGFEGVTGESGATGNYGITGATGSLGVTGSWGSTGATGLGAIGLTGSTGTTGFVGVMGNLGATGSTGSFGSTGIIGETGATGVLGYFSFTGATGSGGELAATGVTGQLGFAGGQGTIGTTGIIASTGNFGLSGDFGFKGATGTIGGIGEIGATGAVGVIGLMGDLGFLGVDGMVGFTGFTGSTGMLGSTGAIGPTGMGIVGATGSVLNAFNAWNINGNTGTTGAHFIGTTDNIPFNLRVYSQKAGRIDVNIANANVYYGFIVGGNTSTGIKNTCFGYSILESNLSGTSILSLGAEAHRNNKRSFYNVAIGSMALYTESSASQIGRFNLALGYQALYTNNPTGSTNGMRNTGVGSHSLWQNTNGFNNTAIGLNSLYSNTTALDNVAIGVNALYSNTTGNNNTAIGNRALYTNTTGTQNTAVGYKADVSAGNLTNATAIGANAVVSKSNTMVFGDVNVIGWGLGASPPATLALVVGTNATNGNGAGIEIDGDFYPPSDSTKKHSIMPIKYGLNEVLAMRPVNYKWKVTNQKDFGFIAQEIKTILPEIVYGEEGHMGVGYLQITAVLTKTVQELNAKYEEENLFLQQQALLIEEMKKELDVLKNKKSQSK